jgi:predicted GNAT superfamily acetyltransferase
VAEPVRQTTPTGGATVRPGAAPSAEVTVRPLRSNEDCHACVELQREIWGFDQAEIVPSTVLHVVEYVGGLVAGAFDAHGTLLGFVFGISGVRDGQLAHWSHMLGVRESARNLGVGRMLKEYQRATLEEMGITRIFWSFDPLMAKNAHFNINRLGASVVEYVPDMYGTTASPLHLGMATDRLIVCLDSSEQRRSIATIPSELGIPILSPFARLSDVTLSVGDWSPNVVLIEMPIDILDLLGRSPSAAQTWRLAVRDNFRWAMQRGYSVTGVHRSAGVDRAFYILTRGADAQKKN